VGPGAASAAGGKSRSDAPIARQVIRARQCTDRVERSIGPPPVRRSTLSLCAERVQGPNAVPRVRPIVGELIPRSARRGRGRSARSLSLRKPDETG
jgi:hypothetical protein